MREAFALAPMMGDCSYIRTDSVPRNTTSVECSVLLTPLP